MEILAVIPARGGSKGLPGKNIIQLGGHPLVSYSICAALQSDLITRVICSTDDDNIAEIATKTLVNISEFLSPIFLPKKPEMIEEIKGKKTIICSYVILTF